MASKVILGLLLIAAVGYSSWRNGHRTGGCSNGSCVMQVLLDSCHTGSRADFEPEQLSVMPREVAVSENVE